MIHLANLITLFLCCEIVFNRSIVRFLFRRRELIIRIWLGEEFIFLMIKLNHARIAKHHFQTVIKFFKAINVNLCFTLLTIPYLIICSEWFFTKKTRVLINYWLLWWYFIFNLLILLIFHSTTVTIKCFWVWVIF